MIPERAIWFAVYWTIVGIVLGILFWVCVAFAREKKKERHYPPRSFTPPKTIDPPPAPTPPRIAQKTSRQAQEYMHPFPDDDLPY